MWTTAHHFPTSPCFSVCVYVHSLMLSLSVFSWFPGVGLFLCLLAAVYELLWLWMRVCWPHSEVFCWKQPLLCIKFRSLRWVGDVSGNGLGLPTQVYGKWVLSEKWRSTERQQEEGASEIARPSCIGKAWRGLGSRDPEVIHSGMFASRTENTSSPKGVFWCKTCLGYSRDWNTSKMLSYVI